MPLDPETKTILDLLASYNAPPMSAGDPATARSGFQAMTVGMRTPESVVPVGATEDRTIDRPAGPMKIRIYRPEREGALPTVVFFHGGGFVIGDIETHDNQCRRICSTAEAVVVSVDYRLAPEDPWPAAVDDCLAATRWAVQHMDELGGDPDRIAVGGDSAGGNLAAAVAQVFRDEHIGLAAQLLIYPAVDLRGEEEDRYPSVLENSDGYLLTLDDMLWFHGHYVGDRDADDPRVSPILGRLEDLPPAVLVTAEFDPLRDSGEAYARLLEEAGVKVYARRFHGLIHGFFDLVDVSRASAAAVEQTCADLHDLLW